jgi:hypothetical protein
MTPDQKPKLPSGTRAIRPPYGSSVRLCQSSQCRKAKLRVVISEPVDGRKVKRPEATSLWSSIGALGSARLR